MMKTPEEIKLEIQECCEQIADSGLALWVDGEFFEQVLGDALALIRQLEARVAAQWSENRAILSTVTMQERVRADLEVRISQLEAQSPRWISVEERLPEDCKDVLVRIARGDASRIVCAWLLNGEWHYLNVRCDGDRVTYWMPLPEPPEEE